MDSSVQQNVNSKHYDIPGRTELGPCRSLNKALSLSMTNFTVDSRKRYNEVERSLGWLNNSNGNKVQRTVLDVVGGTKMGKN